jgi:hypothetical protein
LKKGLPAADGPEKLPSDFEIKIGKVRPFAAPAPGNLHFDLGDSSIAIHDSA